MIKPSWNQICTNPQDMVVAGPEGVTKTVKGFEKNAGNFTPGTVVFDTKTTLP